MTIRCGLSSEVKRRRRIQSYWPDLRWGGRGHHKGLGHSRNLRLTKERVPTSELIQLLPDPPKKGIWGVVIIMIALDKGGLFDMR